MCQKRGMFTRQPTSTWKKQFLRSKVLNIGSECNLSITSSITGKGKRSQAVFLLRYLLSMQCQDESSFFFTRTTGEE